MSVLTVILALAAGLIFALNMHVQRMALDTADPMAGAFYSVLTMAGLLWLASPLFADWSWLLTPSTALFALAGLFVPALGQRFQVASLGLVGPALTSAIGSFTPLFAIVPAVLFLGERVNAQAAAGIGLMIAALVLSAIGRRGIPRGWPLWALALPLAAAAARGGVQPLTKAGMEAGPNAFFAMMILASVSTLVLGGMLAVSGRPGALRSAGAGGRWFAVSGGLNCLGMVALFTAIEFGDIAVAAPLSALTPLWTLILGALVFRRETLGPRHLWIALLVAAGAGLLVTR